MIFLRLFLVFLKIGAFTFGGGYAMIPLIQAEVVGAGWMTDEQLINFIAVSESTPGPFAVNIATYVGMEAGGIGGALCATFGVVLPSFLIILLIARVFTRFAKSAPVQAERAAAHGGGPDRGRGPFGGAHGLCPARRNLAGAAFLGHSLDHPNFYPGGLFAVEAEMASHRGDSAGCRAGHRRRFRPGGAAAGIDGPPPMEAEPGADSR